jgi:hypothetical protein
MMKCGAKAFLDDSDIALGFWDVFLGVCIIDDDSVEVGKLGHKRLELVVT